MEVHCLVQILIRVLVLQSNLLQDVTLHRLLRLAGLAALGGRVLFRHVVATLSWIDWSMPRLRLGVPDLIWMHQRDRCSCVPAVALRSSLACGRSSLLMREVLHRPIELSDIRDR